MHAKYFSIIWNYVLSVSSQRKYNFYHQNTLLDAFRTNSRNIIGRNPSMEIPLLANQDLTPILKAILLLFTRDRKASMAIQNFQYAWHFLVSGVYYKTHHDWARGKLFQNKCYRKTRKHYFQIGSACNSSKTTWLWWCNDPILHEFSQVSKVQGCYTPPPVATAQHVRHETFCHFIPRSEESS